MNTNNANQSDIQHGEDSAFVLVRNKKRSPFNQYNNNRESYDGFQYTEIIEYNEMIKGANNVKD